MRKWIANKSKEAGSEFEEMVSTGLFELVALTTTKPKARPLEVANVMDFPVKE